MIASATDLSFSLYGYSAVIGNDFLTALYLILVKNTPATAGLTTTGLLFYNAALSLPILGVALAASNEPAGIAAYPDAGSWGFRVIYLLLLLHLCPLTNPLIALTMLTHVLVRYREVSCLARWHACFDDGNMLGGLMTTVLRAGCSGDVLYAGPDHQPLDLHLHALQRPADDQRGRQREEHHHDLHRGSVLWRLHLR